LDNVKQIVKIVGFVVCTDDFEQQPNVINGASDFFVEVFGEKGNHARSAVGTNALPLGIATEVECIVEIEC
jgi:enamine deaminase RidA (YjgF/YER057c/UK114 family)